MSDDAVTESEARRLLGAAAATIEVDDPAPLTLTGLPEPRPHRRWSVLVAVAASVVLLASAAWVVARQLGDGKQVPPEPLERRETGVPALVGQPSTRLGSRWRPRATGPSSRRCRRAPTRRGWSAAQNRPRGSPWRRAAGCGCP